MSPCPPRLPRWRARGSCRCPSRRTRRRSSRGVMISAPVGKVRALTCFTARAVVASGSSSRCDAGGGHLAQVVRRDVGGHADRDARGAVEQHVRQPRRQQRRLLQRAVEVRHPVDRALRPARRAACRRSASAATRCSASPRTTSDRRASPSCPGRRRSGSGRRSPAPCAPWPRSRPSRRADGTCRSRRRRCARISCACSPPTRPSSLIA